MKQLMQMWNNPQLRILIIFNLAVAGILLIAIFTCVLHFVKNRREKNKFRERELQKFQRFIERFKDNKDVPGEIAMAFEELHEEIVILEEAVEERFSTIIALVQGLEEQNKMAKSSVGLIEQKTTIFLQSVLGRLKKTNRETIRKEAENIFTRLNRIENTVLLDLVERMVELESFVEAYKMIRSPSGEMLAVSDEGMAVSK